MSRALVRRGLSLNQRNCDQLSGNPRLCVLRFFGCFSAHYSLAEVKVVSLVTSATSVEDDKKITSFVVKGLKEAGFAVDCADNGEDGLRMAPEGAV